MHTPRNLSIEVTKFFHAKLHEIKYANLFRDDRTPRLLNCFTPCTTSIDVNSSRHQTIRNPVSSNAQQTGAGYNWPQSMTRYITSCVWPVEVATFTNSYSATQSRSTLDSESQLVASKQVSFQNHNDDILNSIKYLFQASYSSISPMLPQLPANTLRLYVTYSLNSKRTWLVFCRTYQVKLMHCTQLNTMGPV